MLATSSLRLPLGLRAWIAVACLAALLVVGHASSGSLTPAHAFSSGNFCWAGGGWQVIQPGQRCVNVDRQRHRYLKATALFGDQAGQFCVGAKQNPDGTGGNTKAFGCHIPTLYPGKDAISPAEAAPGSPLGYATIINNMAGADFFMGYKQWYP